MNRPAISKHDREGDEGPTARKFQDDGRLEGLDLGILLGKGDRGDGNANQSHENDIFDRPQAAHAGPRAP